MCLRKRRTRTPAAPGERGGASCGPRAVAPPLSPAHQAPPPRLPQGTTESESQAAVTGPQAEGTKGAESSSSRRGAQPCQHLISLLLLSGQAGGWGTPPESLTLDWAGAPEETPPLLVGGRSCFCAPRGVQASPRSGRKGPAVGGWPCAHGPPPLGPHQVWSSERAGRQASGVGPPLPFPPRLASVLPVTRPPVPRGFWSLLCPLPPPTHTQVKR